MFDQNTNTVLKICSSHFRTTNPRQQTFSRMSYVGSSRNSHVKTITLQSQLQNQRHMYVHTQYTHIPENSQGDFIFIVQTRARAGLIRVEHVRIKDPPDAR